jgi:hypothetical protein
MNSTDGKGSTRVSRHLIPVVLLGTAVVVALPLSALVFLSLWDYQQPLMTDSNSLEIAILEAELQASRRYEDRFFQLILWSLTTLFGLAVLIAGFSWYANTRQYDRDLDALRVEAQVTALESLTDLNDRFGVLQKEVQGVYNEYQERSTSLNEAQHEQFRQLWTEHKKQADVADERLQKSVNQRLSQVEASLLEKIEMLQLKIYDQESSWWELKGVWANVLSVETRKLERLEQLPNDWELPYSFDRIREAIQQTPKFQLSESSLADLRVALSKLQDKHPHAVRDIERLIDQRRNE